MKYESILDLIGNTPMVGVHALSPNPAVRIYAKLEGQNPGGSSKDRIALKMVELAEKDGKIRPGDTILEPSSGNTGIGLALVARVRGYGLRVVMPENVSPERRQLLEIFGAEITLSPADEGSNGAIRRAQRIVADEPGYVFLYQYGNPANPLAHYETTGPEIWRDCPEVDVFVAGLGTGGTLMGVGRRLKRHRADIRVYAAEPLPGDAVQGLRSLDEGFIPEIFDPSVLDGKLLVSNAESIAALRELTFREGIFAGVSSGGAIVAAQRVAASMDHGTVVVLLADGGWKYLSEDIWTRDMDADHDDVERLNLW
jgi:cysteine synthase B